MKGLKKLRNERGLTLAAVASEMGVIPNAVWRWEAGARTPSIEMLKRLAAFFDCTIDELVANGAPENTRSPALEEKGC